MLYIVATPIGHLEDISLRALKVLKSVDYILAEDTRHTRKLLFHYEIETKTSPLHRFNEKGKAPKVLADLEAGVSVALVCDAGTPCICDAGALLVKMCRDQNLPVFPVPGCNACIAALSTCGLDILPFQFLGFLERDTKRKREQIEKAVNYEGSSVFYETPHRLKSTLRLWEKLSPNSELHISREITKMFEEYKRGTPGELLTHFTLSPPKGEIVLLSAPMKDTLKEGGQKALPPPETLIPLLKREYSLSHRDAIKLTASLTGLPKNTLYAIDQESR